MTTPRFNRDFVGVISAARLIAEKKGVSDAEASDYLSRKLSEIGVNIYRVRDGEPYLLLGEAWYAPMCDEITEVLSCDWRRHPELLDCVPPGVRWLPNEFAIEWADAENHFGIRRPYQIQGNETDGMEHVAVLPYQPKETELAISVCRSPLITIRGNTFSRLQRAIAAFPSRYPEHATCFPKLDTDMRPWLKEAGIASNEREAHVFSTILAEHFEVLPDTQKSQ